MSDEIKMEGNFDELRARKAWMEAFIKKAVMRLVNSATLSLQRHIREDLFIPYSPTGPRPMDRLQTRSGQLKKSVINIPAYQIDEDTIKGGIGIGKVYGHVQFGKRGEKTTITAKGKMLTIPLPAAMDSHGVAKGPAGPKGKYNPIFGETFVLPGKSTKSGHPIICGKLRYVKEQKAGQTKGRIVPLFMLVPSVTVPVRIASEDLARWVQPILGKGMADLKSGLSSGTYTE